MSLNFDLISSDLKQHFKIMSDEEKMKILSFLNSFGNSNFNLIKRSLKMNSSKLNHHLRLLIEFGFVIKEKSNGSNNSYVYLLNKNAYLLFETIASVTREIR